MEDNHMNNSQVSEQTTAADARQAGEKTFSQEDVNRIIGERLAKEKAANDAKMAQRERELAQRELLLTAKEKITSAGLPAELAQAINMTSAESVDRALEIIRKVIKDKREKPSEVTGIRPVPTLTTGSGGERGFGRSDGIRDAMGLRR